MKRIYVTLTEEEKEKLTMIAADNGAMPCELLAAFVADLTCSCRTGGSDEWQYAVEWLYRQVCRWHDGKLCT